MLGTAGCGNASVPTVTDILFSATSQGGDNAFLLAMTSADIQRPPLLSSLTVLASFGNIPTGNTAKPIPSDTTILENVAAERIAAILTKNRTEIVFLTAFTNPFAINPATPFSGYQAATNELFRDLRRFLFGLRADDVTTIIQNTTLATFRCVILSNPGAQTETVVKNESSDKLVTCLVVEPETGTQRFVFTQEISPNTTAVHLITDVEDRTIATNAIATDIATNATPAITHVLLISPPNIAGNQVVIYDVASQILFSITAANTNILLEDCRFTTRAIGATTRILCVMRTIIPPSQTLVGLPDIARILTTNVPLLTLPDDATPISLPNALTPKGIGVQAAL